ncbi:MAG TPA: hypothetical protein ENK19_07380 [Acidobacteria bacterium]|nr:hypothetical protein [Acidobacteriota bacterium]
MRPGTSLCLALLVTLLAVSVQAGELADGDQRAPTAVDQWHRLHHFYSMEPEQPEGRRLRFGICPGIGVRAGNPGGVFGVADLYVSMTRRHSFSLFAGVGVEGTGQLRSVVYTVGWGGVRRIQVARHQTGFFGAFLRYRDYVGEVSTSREDAFSAGTELGAGHLGFTFEMGASRRTDGDWKFLIYAGFKFVWAVPLGW